MPTFNLRPILFPRAKKDDVYDMLADLRDIKLKQAALDQGGEIFNPDTYNEALADTLKIINDPSIDEKRRRQARADYIDLQIKQLKTELAKKKEIDTGDLRQLITQDLRIIEFRNPEDPWQYSIEALTKYQDMLYGTALGEDVNNIYDLLDIFKKHHTDTIQLERVINEFEMEEFKYSEITDAFERVNSLNKEERERALKTLEEYATVYTPYIGKVKAMEIISLVDKKVEYMKPTNLKFSVDEEGKLATGGDEIRGLSIYFKKANAVGGDTYNFAGIDFEYDGSRFVTRTPERLNYQKIKHATIHEIKSGTFVKDSKDKLYYINQDRTFTPIRNDRYKDELGFQEDEVYNLNYDEELNTLPGAISTFIPTSILERYQREEEVAKEAAERMRREVEWKPWTPWVREEIGRGILGMPTRIREWGKEAMRRAEERRKERIIPEEPKWEAPEVPTPTELLKRGKEFIKKLGI